MSGLTALQALLVRTARAHAQGKPKHGRRGCEARPVHRPGEEGNVKMWVIITLISAVLIALLLAISGPTLGALLGQVLDKFG